MKLIWAVLRSTHKKKVEQALMENGVGVTGLLAWSVLGLGEETQRLFQPHELTYVKMNILVRDDQVGPVLKTIRDAVWTGAHGDGLLAVMPVEKVIHISSGREDEEALSR